MIVETCVSTRKCESFERGSPKCVHILFSQSDSTTKCIAEGHCEHSLRLKNHLRDFVTQLSWDYLGALPEELEKISVEREVLQKKMDG